MSSSSSSSSKSSSDSTIACKEKLFKEFVCKLKFRKSSKEPSIDCKLLALPLEISRYSKLKLFEDEKTAFSEYCLDVFKSCPADSIQQTIFESSDFQSSLDPEDEMLIQDLESKQSQSHKHLTSNPQRTLDKQKITEIPEEEEEEINTRNDLVNCIANSFEQTIEVKQHPFNPTLKPVKIYNLIPDDKIEEHSLVQCNFDSEDKIFGNSTILKRITNQKGTEKYFNFYQNNNQQDNYKFIREYNYHSYLEEGISLVLSFDRQNGIAKYFSIQNKYNLRKRRSSSSAISTKSNLKIKRI